MFPTEPQKCDLSSSECALFCASFRGGGGELVSNSNREVRYPYLCSFLGMQSLILEDPE